MDRVLITGGAGFIGSHIAQKLIGKGYEVTVLDKLLEQIHGIDPDKTSPLYCSIKDKVRFIVPQHYGTAEGLGQLHILSVPDDVDVRMILVLFQV